MLSNKTLIMLVGPSAMGKSTILNTAVQQDPRFTRVRSFTTRKPRPNDEPDQYFYVSFDELEQLQQAGEVVTSVEFPTTGQMYGTLQTSYGGEYCLLDTLSNSVDLYRALPFKQTATLSVTTPVDMWHEWFLQRFPKLSDEAQRRLDEATISINWSLAQTVNHGWLINDGTPQYAAQKLIAMFLHGLPSDDGANNAQAILQRIEQGMWT